MVSRAINNKLNSWQLMELHFLRAKDSEDYDAPQLPLVKFIVNCTRNHAITSTNRGHRNKKHYFGTVFLFSNFSGFWNFKNRSTILVIIFWHFLIIQLTSESPQVKPYLISSVTNLVHKLPHELLNNLRLRILGNQEILGKCQMWVQTQPNAQSSFQTLNVDNSCQKTCKIRYIFETLPNFIVSLHFLPNILSRIVVVNLNKHF